MYLIITPDHKEEYKTRSVYAVIVEGEVADTDTASITADAETADADTTAAVEETEAEKTVKKIEEALSSDSSPESFAKLAKEYSAGRADAYYKNTPKNYFNDSEIDAWLFDESRAVGDRKTFAVTSTNTSTGEEDLHYMVIQYAGEGIMKWEYDADAKLRSADLEAKSEEFDTNYGGDKITVNKTDLYKMA